MDSCTRNEHLNAHPITVFLDWRPKSSEIGGSLALVQIHIETLPTAIQIRSTDVAGVDIESTYWLRSRTVAAAKIELKKGAWLVR